MMRIVLFLATNLAVLLLVSLVFNLLGLQGILAQNGVDLNLGSLLTFCALFGFGGVAAASAGIAKILFFIFLVLFVLSLIAGLVGRRPPA